MKTGKTICIVFALVLAAAGVPASAQSRVEAKINRIDLKAQKTPVFRESLHSSQGLWGRIDVEFDTRGREWLNDVEIRWTVAINADNLSKPALLQMNATYTDVREGRRAVCAYIPPKFFERYMKGRGVDSSKVSVYVELYSGGQRLARNERRNSRMPDNWFTMSDRMQAFPGILLPKYKTPFACMDYDYYEVEKQQ